MENKDIRLLYINSSAHALININQSPIGQTGINAISQPIADSAFFITMLPLESEENFAYLPYTRRVSIAKNGKVFGNDALIDICVWTDNIVELTLHPLAIYKGDQSEILPSVLSPFEFFISGERHTAFIYNEASSSFAIEHAATSRLKYIFPLTFRVKSADMSFVKLGEFPVIYTSGKTAKDETFLFVASVLPTFKKEICTLCESFEVGDSFLSVVNDEEFGQKKTTYATQESSLLPVQKDLGWFTKDAVLPSTPEQACACLLQAVKADKPDIAMDCLTPSLSEGLSFADLCEFFGDFVSITKALSPACVKNSFALKYLESTGVYTARNFCIETKQSHGRVLIDNISEP